MAEASNVAEQELRSYIYQGEIYVLVDPFAIWTLQTHGLDYRTVLFGQALLMAGGRDGSVPSSAVGKTIHVWKMPTSGQYAITMETLRKGPLL